MGFVLELPTIASPQITVRAVLGVALTYIKNVTTPFDCKNVTALDIPFDFGGDCDGSTMTCSITKVG